MSEISDEEIDRQLNKFFAEKGDFGSWIAKMKAICLTLRSERDEARRELGAHRERIKMQRERHITLTEQLAAKDAEIAELKEHIDELEEALGDVAPSHMALSEEIRLGKSGAKP